MKERAIYWRRKNKKIIAEGKENGRTIYLFQLPDVEKVLNSSLFSSKKKAKINEIIRRLDFKKNKEKNNQ